MAKFEIISQKPSKTKKWPFFDTFWPKNPQFWISPRVPLLTYASKHLGEDFRKFAAKSNDKIQSYQQKTFKKWPFGPKTPILDPPGGLKGMKMNFSEKSENVMFLHSLRLSYMKKSENSIARFSGKTSTDRQRERETERDGSEFKGPPDAIAKPSDQKELP